MTTHTSDDIIEKISTWADGYGNWHARITIPACLEQSEIANHSHAINKVAREAITDELAQREQKTHESLEQARKRISRSLGLLRIEHSCDPDSDHHHITFSER